MEKMNLSESVWNKRFTSLFISRLIKNTGESFAFTSVLWLLILRGDGALGTGLLLAVTVLPSSLLAPILGPLMKKHHLSKWMFASDVVRATIVLIIPLLHFSHLLPLWLLISLMVIQSATGAAYNPASVAILPQIVPKHLIQKANAILQSSFEIVALAAVMVAGLLVKLIGPADTLLITTALFVISGLFIIGVKLKKTDEEKAAGIKQAKNTYLYNLKRGFLVVKNHHILFALTLLLEERMMWLGRNDLVRVIDLQDSKDTYDLIFIQSEEPHNRQEDIKAEHGMYRILYEKPENESAKQNVPAVILPRMFGPWSLNEDRTKRADSLFVEDVAKELLQWASGIGQRQDMTYELKVERQTDDKQAEDMIAEWKRQNSTFFDKKQE
ncbi:hypothetical protein BSAF29S_05799 [Bacillus safensis subsp. safensis]